MKERPILFNGEMVRATLDGRKTQTRRAIKPQPGFQGNTPIECIHCPYGDPGDRLWVRETWAKGPQNHGWGEVIYKATFGAMMKPVCEGFTKWKSPRFMPRKYSRITLEVTGVRVERLQDITHRDALAEGVSYDVSKSDGAPLKRFQVLWDSNNAKGGFGWDDNPWVWVIEFKAIQ